MLMPSSLTSSKNWCTPYCLLVFSCTWQFLAGTLVSLLIYATIINPSHPTVSKLHLLQQILSFKGLWRAMSVCLVIALLNKDPMMLSHFLFSPPLLYRPDDCPNDTLALSSPFHGFPFITDQQ